MSPNYCFNMLTIEGDAYAVEQVFSFIRISHPTQLTDRGRGMFQSMDFDFQNVIPKPLEVDGYAYWDCPHNCTSASRLSTRRGNSIWFTTVCGPPLVVIEHLSIRFAQLRFHLDCADDSYWLANTYQYQNGQMQQFHRFGSWETNAHELRARVGHSQFIDYWPGGFNPVCARPACYHAFLPDTESYTFDYTPCSCRNDHINYCCFNCKMLDRWRHGLQLLVNFCARQITAILLLLAILFISQCFNLSTVVKLSLAVPLGVSLGEFGSPPLIKKYGTAFIRFCHQRQKLMKYPFYELARDAICLGYMSSICLIYLGCALAEVALAYANQWASGARRIPS